ncbi:ABC transporter ATP-binding protein [Candidatus Bipolaricaulota bacterium]|nr:ABC transporter ATP-binding protein [Candidatus Bipolaricaulota bacterium]TFH10883.1 MAG: ABC transporter ATP-binding protein [Candidatus Atribacteria bacterium]
MKSEPVLSTLEMKGIVKRFPGVLANDGVDFDVRAGEIHALLGENGAGKSTLMKVLYGMYSPDEGQILINGKPVTLRSPLDAISHGIGMIHQHFMLVPTLTVAENVALGLSSSRRIVLDLDRVTEKVHELSEAYRLRVDPSEEVWRLSVGEQQRVEILKALYRGADLLILDEPTAVLTPQDVDELFNTLRTMSEEGHSLVFISHKLPEVLRLSARATVLRDGRVAGSVMTNAVSQADLACMMVGREVLLRIDHPDVERGDVRLMLDGVHADGDRGFPSLCGIDLEVHAGEILGIAGVSGNGQRELAEVIAGTRSISAGTVTLNGEDMTQWSTHRRLEAGIAHIPEERMVDGAVQEFSVEENLILKNHGHAPYSRGIFMNFKAIAAMADRLIQRYDIKTPSRQTQIGSLSGGNMQKLILAREISRNPDVLIAAQPTRGLDIGATEFVHQQIVAQRADGTAILLISEDLDEVLSLSDRIAVMYEGSVVGVVDRKSATANEVGRMMAGGGCEAAGARSLAPVSEPSAG